MTTGEGSTAGPSPALRFSEARRRLGGAQKSVVGVPAYLRFVNRRIGGWLAAGAHGLGLTPNLVTAASAACSVLAIAVLALVDTSLWVGIAVAVALLAGFALDSADGQLSRVRGDGRPSGEWLDHVVDMAKTASLHAAVAIAWFRFAPERGDAWLLVPLAFGITDVTYFFAMMLRDQLGARPAPAGPGPVGGTAPGSVARSFLLLPMDYGVLCLSFALLGVGDLFVGAYTGLLVLNVGFAAQSLVKAYRLLAAGR
ncbi:MAG: Phosphatidylglycerophosphate synthase [Acidimicrobiales bacterium]|nr:Phosphatidylglycerophosphate synthase [Acidimicrobiales bacterium]